MTTPEPHLTSTKPYLIRAIYEWLLDNGLTPHLLVDTNYPGTEVPLELAPDGQIVLNLAPGAVRDLVLGNEWISCGARFGGIPRELLVPAEAVLGIFSRENRQGMLFPQPDYPESEGESAHTALHTVAAGEGRSGASSQGEGDRPKGPPKGPSTGPGKGRGGPSLKVVK
jgi:stringent starvation protein B